MTGGGKHDRLAERRGDSHGLTILEMMATISVVLIILSITIPLMTRTLAWLEYDAAIRQITQDIRMTQLLALAVGRPVFLQVRPNHTYAIKQDELHTFLVRSFPPQMRFKTTAVNQYYPKIRFNPDGVIAEGMGTLIITHEQGFERRLTVQLYSGMVLANE